jgi:hypothetical protein
MNAREFLVNLCKMRKHSIDHGCAKKNVPLLMQYYREVNAWLNAFQTNHEQCRTYIMRNRYKIEYLMPGGEGKVANSWRNKLEDLCHDC